MHQNAALCGNGLIELFVSPFPNKPWVLHVCSRSLMKTLGKGEIACNEQFLFPKRISAFFINLKLSSANSLSLEESKFCCLGKG